MTQSANGFPADELRKVLLVADDLSLRSLVSTFLAGIDCGCAAVSPAQVYSAFARETFDAVILDADQPESVIESDLSAIKECRPGLWTRILLVTSAQVSPSLKELIERHSLPHISREEVHRQLWTALQDLIAPQHIPKATFRNMQTAELTFDSSRGYLPEGLRGFRANCRQVIFQHRSSTVDLLIEPREDSGRIAVTGQVLHSHKRKADDEGLPVLLVSGIRTMTRTSTNQSGEFCFECAPLQEACVEMRLREGDWVSLSLGELDWAFRKMPE